MNEVLSKFYNGGLLGKLHELRGSDPRASHEIEKTDEMTDQAKRDRALFKEMEEKNYHFGTHTANNPAGTRWRRALQVSETLRTKYAKQHGYGNQREFRAKWMRKEHAQWKKRWVKSKLTKFERAQIKHGEYCSLSRIAKIEGGGVEGNRI
eukprot:1754347-Pyramimonas_sp.AAC.1